MYHCKVDEFPTVCEWPLEARDPILERIVRFFFDTFQVEVSFLTGRRRFFDVGRNEVIGDLQKRIAKQEKMKESTIYRLQFRGTNFSEDTPIAATGIEQGSRMHCYPKLPGGVRTKQKISVVAVKKEREAKTVARRKVYKMMTGKKADGTLRNYSYLRNHERNRRVRRVNNETEPQLPYHNCVPVGKTVNFQLVFNKYHT